MVNISTQFFVLPILVLLTLLKKTRAGGFFDYSIEEENQNTQLTNQLTAQQQSQILNLRRIIDGVTDYDSTQSGLRQNILNDVVQKRYLVMPQQQSGMLITATGETVPHLERRFFRTAQDGNMYFLGENVTKEEDLAATKDFLENLVGFEQNDGNAHISKPRMSPQFVPVEDSDKDNSWRSLSLRKVWNEARKPHYHSSPHNHYSTNSHSKGGKGGDKKGKKEKKGKGQKTYSPTSPPTHHHHNDHNHFPTHFPHQHHSHSPVHSPTPRPTLHPSFLVTTACDGDCNDYTSYSPGSIFFQNDLEKKYNKQFTLLVASEEIGGEEVDVSEREVGYEPAIKSTLYNTSGRYVGKGYSSCVYTNITLVQCTSSIILVNQGQTVAQLDLHYLSDLKLTGTDIPRALSIIGGSGIFSGAQGSIIEKKQQLNSVPQGCKHDEMEVTEETEETEPCVDSIWELTLYEYYDHPYPSASGECAFC